MLHLIFTLSIARIATIFAQADNYNCIALGESCEQDFHCCGYDENPRNIRCEERIEGYGQRCFYSDFYSDDDLVIKPGSNNHKDAKCDYETNDYYNIHHNDYENYFYDNDYNFNDPNYGENNGGYYYYDEGHDYDSNYYYSDYQNYVDTMYYYDYNNFYADDHSDDYNFIYDNLDENDFYYDSYSSKIVYYDDEEV